MLRNISSKKKIITNQVIVGSFYSYNYINYDYISDIYKTLSMKEYLNKIEPYLKDIINNFKKSDVWKIQLIKAINFVSSKDIEKERAMHQRVIR